MKITFKKKYDDGITWTEVVMDFLEVLSEKFEYNIDEFDLLRMPTSTKLNRLGKLLNGNPESETYGDAFSAVCRESIDMHKYVEARRRKAVEVAKAMSPSSVPLDIMGADIEPEAKDDGGEE